MKPSIQGTPKSHLSPDKAAQRKFEGLALGRCLDELPRMRARGVYVALHGFIGLNKVLWSFTWNFVGNANPLIQESAREMCRIAEHKGFVQVSLQKDR